MFERIRPVLPEVAAEVGVRLEGSFGAILAAEWRPIEGLDATRPEVIADADLHEVYDARARELPWDLSPGYLASFARNRGSAYSALRVYEVIDQLLPPVAGRRVLEVGCGAGILVVELALRGARAVGLEVAGPGLRFGRALARRLGAASATGFVRGDGEQLPFPDRSFDVLVSTEVLEHFLRPERALAEMRRVLRPDGVLVLTTPCAWSPSEACMAVARWLKPDLQVESEVHFDKKLYFALARDGRAPDARRLWRVHRRFEFAPLGRALAAAGFERERVLGAVLDVPPHFHLVYRWLLWPFLPLVRAGEWLLNRVGVLPRFAAVSTCFRLRPAAPATPAAALPRPASSTGAVPAAGREPR